MPPSMFINSETDPCIHTHPSMCSPSETHSRVQLRPSDSTSVRIRSAARIRTALNSINMLLLCLKLSLTMLMPEAMLTQNFQNLVPEMGI